MAAKLWRASVSISTLSENTKRALGDGHASLNRSQRPASVVERHFTLSRRTAPSVVAPALLKNYKPRSRIHLVASTHQNLEKIAQSRPREGLGVSPCRLDKMTTLLKQEVHCIKWGTHPHRVTVATWSASLQVCTTSRSCVLPVQMSPHPSLHERPEHVSGTQRNSCYTAAAKFITSLQTKNLPHLNLHLNSSL